MENKDQADQLLAIGRFYIDRWADKRKHEWQMTCGFWIFLTIAAICLRGAGLAVALFFVAILAIAAIAYVWLWVRGNWVANERDRRKAIYFVESAEQLLTGSPDPDRYRKSRGACVAPGETDMTRDDLKLGFLRAWPCRFSIAATAILVVALSTILLSGPNTVWPGN